MWLRASACWPRAAPGYLEDWIGVCNIVLVMRLLARSVPALCILLLFSGCSRSKAQALPEELSSPGATRKTGPLAPEVNAPPVPSLRDEVNTENYTLKSTDGVLTVEVEHSAGTGTMHYADRLRIKLAGQVIERRSRVNEEQEQMAPLVDRIVPLTGRRYLLLGWASRGSGQQQEHALLIDASPGKLTLLDELILSTHRSRAALFVRTRGTPAIGVPGDTTDMDDREDRWSFSTLSGELDSAQFLSLKSVFTSNKAPDVVRYAPPFHRAIDEERKVVWFEIDERRVRLPVVLVDSKKHLDASMDFESFHIPEQDLWVDLDDDGQPDVLRCIGDGCMASPCTSYKVYIHRPGGQIFAGSINGSLATKSRVLPQKFAGFRVIESGDGAERYRFERGRYRCFESRECKSGRECSPWQATSR